MDVAGQKILVVPLLVTGCKIWHLRPEGSFYPKSAWRTAVDALPAGSQVQLHCYAWLHPVTTLHPEAVLGTCSQCAESIKGTAPSFIIIMFEPVQLP